MADEQGSGPEPRVVVLDIERWFVEKGVPNFIESETEGSALDTWTRALPLLVAAYLLLCLNALDLRNWSLAQNLGAAVTGVGIGVAAWAVSNRLRGRPAFDRPRDIDLPELAVFLVGPALASLLFGQPGDAFESMALAVALLLVIFVWSKYGVGPLLWWGVRHGLRQFSELVTLLAKGLPLLLIFNTFLFINAEVWELAGRLDGQAYVLVVAGFFGLGAAFAASRIPRLISELSSFDSWSEVGTAIVGTPADGIELPDDGAPDASLTLGARLNIGLMVLFGQAVQVLLVVVGLTSLFVLFGFFTMELDTISRWTQIAPASELNVLATGMLGDRELVLTEPLLRVSIFLGAFSGMYFTVVLTTDETYRREIADEVGRQVKTAVGVRAAYRVERARRQRTAADRAAADGPPPLPTDRPTDNPTDEVA